MAVLSFEIAQIRICPVYFGLEIMNIVELADAHELWSESTSNGIWKYFKHGINLVPRPPFTLQVERGEYRTTFLYLHEFQQHYLIGWYWASLSQTS